MVGVCGGEEYNCLGGSPLESASRVGFESGIQSGIKWFLIIGPWKVCDRGKYVSPGDRRGHATPPLFIDDAADMFCRKSLDPRLRKPPL